MKIQIDIKSALAGLALGVIAMFAIGAGTESNPVGKYRIETGTGPNGGYTIMVDTQTGQAWAELTGVQNNWGANLADKFWQVK